MVRRRYGNAEHPEYDRRWRGPNGRGACRRCLKEVPKGRETFCSIECVREYTIRSSGTALRSQVFKRDHGVCALCGINAHLLGRVVRRVIEMDAYQHQTGEDLLAELGLHGVEPYKSLWEADHIIAVYDGGGMCGLENLRTLCLPCHRAHSSDQKRDWAVAARHRRGVN